MPIDIPLYSLQNQPDAYIHQDAHPMRPRWHHGRKSGGIFNRKVVLLFPDHARSTANPGAPPIDTKKGACIAMHGQ